MVEFRKPVYLSPRFRDTEAESFNAGRKICHDIVEDGCIEVREPMQILSLVSVLCKQGLEVDR
jgi:hypothetical protein